MANLTLSELRNNLPQHGEATWIGIRPSDKSDIEIVEHVTADPEQGLVGDHYRGRSGNRQVTLIQAEHLAAVASLLGRTEAMLDPILPRRNIVVRGVNLLAMKEKRFWVGDVLLEYTGLCHPCSFMEESLGSGGYNAMRGHGGITARVIEGGLITLGAKVATKAQ